MNCGWNGAEEKARWEVNFYEDIVVVENTTSGRLDGMVANAARQRTAGYDFGEPPVLGVQ